MKTAGFFIIAIALLAFGIWARVSGPCSLWSLAPVKDIPARCFMGGHR